MKLRSGLTDIGSLTPDSSLVNIWTEHPTLVILTAEDGSELRLASMNPGAWVESFPMSYAGFKIWRLDMIEKMWDNWKHQCMPVSYSAPDGAVTLSASVTQSGREWLVSAGKPAVGHELNRIKDMALTWIEDKARPHPRLFAGMDEISEAWSRSEKNEELRKLLTGGSYWKVLGITTAMMTPESERKPEALAYQIETLHNELGRMGRLDLMRSAIRIVTLYDLLMADDFLTQEGKSLFRAQMAYLAYLMADPQCWSMERGLISGNPNMSCSYTLSLGIIACAISDHPEARGWADYAASWMDKWLTDEVGVNGEWMPEGSHYSHVSVEPMITFAIAAKRAGFRDFSNDPRFKKLMLYFAKFNTPRDVQRGGLRSMAAYGRGHGGCSPIYGCAVPLFKESDPTLSATMQWMWKEVGMPVFMPDGRLGGMEPYYQDRRLPASAPKWDSELFPGIGAVLRNGFNTEHESFLLALMSAHSLRNLDIWAPEVGGIAQWFGLGKPLSTMFWFYIGYNERHELLRNGVLLARNWGAPGDPKLPFGHYTDTQFKTFAALPTADYVESTFVNTHTDERDWFPPKEPPQYPKVVPARGTNLVWTRQLMFLKDENAAGPAWIAMRDTVGGGEPTMWQFWTLSEKIGTPSEIADAEAFLADKPGQTNVPARRLPMSDRYTALGQFGVDVEYFIASPKDTPRHTLRYGGTWSNNMIPEYQDLMHLQLRGDGVYFTALFPRRRGEPAPAFASLAGGSVIKASGAFGTDYAFMSTDASDAKAEQGVEFSGTAGSVQERPGFTILSLPAGGAISFKGSHLKSEIAASLKAEKNELTLTLAEGHAGGAVTVGAPGEWKPAAGVKAEINDKGLWVVNMPIGVRSARFAENLP